MLAAGGIALLLASKTLSASVYVADGPVAVCGNRATAKSVVDVNIGSWHFLLSHGIVDVTNNLQSGKPVHMAFNDVVQVVRHAIASVLMLGIALPCKWRPETSHARAREVGHQIAADSAAAQQSATHVDIELGLSLVGGASEPAVHHQTCGQSDVELGVPPEEEESSRADHPQTCGPAEAELELPLVDEASHASDHAEAECFGFSSSDEDDEEVEPRISDSERDKLVLQAATMGIPIGMDALEVRQEAMRVAIARVQSGTGGRGTRADGGSEAEYAADDYANPELMVFGAVKVIGGLLLSPVCDGAGVYIDTLGAVQRSGGGRAAWAAAHSHVCNMGFKFAVLISLPSARRFWESNGFIPMPAARRLRHHWHHDNCAPALDAKERLNEHLRQDAELRGVPMDRLTIALKEASGFMYEPWLLWL